MTSAAILSADLGLGLLIAGAALLAGGFYLLSKKLTSKELTLIATLAAFSSAGRVAFAAVPNVQPSTTLIVISGYVLGPAPGFLVGATTAFASNFFLGHGPWTVWQMLAWGVTGALAGLAGRLAARIGLRTHLKLVLPLSVVAGFAYGWLMDLWFWASFVYPRTAASLVATLMTSAWFDTMHAAGNALFAALLTSRLTRMLSRLKAQIVYTSLPSRSAEVEAGA